MTPIQEAKILIRRRLMQIKYPNPERMDKWKVERLPDIDFDAKLTLTKKKVSRETLDRIGPYND